MTSVDNAEVSGQGPKDSFTSHTKIKCLEYELLFTRGEWEEEVKRSMIIQEENQRLKASQFFQQTFEDTYVESLVVLQSLKKL